MENRVLSEAEIADMEKRTLDRVLEAIEAGDKESAKRLAQRMYNEYLSMHDLYRNWVTATLSFVARRFGDAALEEALKEGTAAWWLPGLQKLQLGIDGIRQRVKLFASGLRGHLQPLHIEEDDEKITLQMRPCGSGGRMIQEGKYEGPNAFYTVEKGQRLTYGRDNFPVYCAHESAMELASIEAGAPGCVVVEPGHELGKDYCSFIVYKDPAKVPDKYYERLGLKKPAPK